MRNSFLKEGRRGLSVSLQTSFFLSSQAFLLFVSLSAYTQTHAHTQLYDSPCQNLPKPQVVAVALEEKDGDTYYSGFQISQALGAIQAVFVF